jgi:D-arabinose 1-dehydrogenase-like Zn-dependent alcohol dehydrogenase
MENCFPLNEKILVDEMRYSFGDINYIERLAVAYGGVSAAQLHASQTVIVAPATGHFSGAVAELAAQIGCSVIALSRSASKLTPLTSRHPRITGLELTGDEGKDIAAIMALCPNGADAFIDISPPEATVSPHHLAVGFKTVRSGATVVFLGAMGDVKVNYVGLMGRSITIKGQFMYSREELVRLVKMVETGVVKLGKDAGHELVNGGYPLEDWETAIAEAEGAVNWGQQVVFLPKH